MWGCKNELRFKDVFQTLLGSLYPVLWPSIYFGRGRPSHHRAKLTIWLWRLSLNYFIDSDTSGKTFVLRGRSQLSTFMKAYREYAF